MKVLKFGGTSVGNPERMKSLLSLIQLQKAEKTIVVLSAVAGTTNHLVAISDAYHKGEKEEALTLIANLYDSYVVFIQELFSTPEGLQNGSDLINHHFDLLKGFAQELFTTVEERIILAQGELLSTTLFQFYLKEIGVQSVLLPALSFMRVDDEHEPIMDRIHHDLSNLLDNHPFAEIFITQGFICRNAFGEIDNLRRGGSDYTASLIGGALRAEEVQIWTDIDGFHNNDPRYVNNTSPIENLSFEEAAELAYFGAKILHPQSVFPAQRYKVPVRLLDTLLPQAKGTLISDSDENKGKIIAIAAKDGIIAIRIHSTRMLLAYGFLRRVFEVFERYKTPIDMITTSEVAVSVTIDNSTHLENIVADLADFGDVEVDENQSIVCVVGDFGPATHGHATRVVEAVKHIPVRMISYGGSEHNISLLVHTENKIEVLRSLQNRLF